ncbi:MAG: hypothetical protein IJQ11_07915 [Bacteroidales bacterium]|nr:hypothetical protein [Bacteroidales bacterium]
MLRQPTAQAVVALSHCGSRSLSILQAPNRYNEYAIIAAVRKLSSGDNHQERRLTHFGGVHLVSESDEVFRPFLNLITS